MAFFSPSGGGVRLQGFRRKVLTDIPAGTPTHRSMNSGYDLKIIMFIGIKIIRIETNQKTFNTEILHLEGSTLICSFCNFIETVRRKFSEYVIENFRAS